MGDFYRFAFLETNRLRIGLGLEITARLTSGIALRHLLPIFRLVVPRFEIDTSVHLPRLQAADRVSEVLSGSGRSRAGPVVGRVVGSVRREWIEIRHAVERHVPTGGEDLLVGVGRTETRQRTLDSVAPSLVFIVVELIVEIASFEYLRCVFTFVDSGVECRLERELHVLGQVVFDIYVTIPREILAEGQIHSLSTGTGQVAHFHMAERAMHVHIERP